MKEMLQALDTYVKLAVDIQRGILAGGGTLHADCEAVLIEDGSRQEDVWGQNPSLEILSPAVRERVAQIVRQLLEGV
jgi:hypothetical protein